MLIPLIGVVTPLIALPAITAQFGATAWAAVAVGQASGAMAATVLELGWGWNGPMRVARANDRSRRVHLVWALTSRGAILPFAILGAFITAYLIAPSFALDSGLIAVGATFMGLSSVWFFTGLGRPWMSIVTDAIPRAVGVSLAAALIAFSGAPLIVYPMIGLWLPALASVILPLLVAGVGPRDFAGIRPRRVAYVLASQSSIVSARMVSSLYMQLPTLIVTIVTPVPQAATFAAGDRLARMFLSGLSAVPNFFQRWVGAPDSREERLSRARKATWANILIGACAGVAFAILAPWFSQFIFSGTATLTFGEGLILGMLVLIVCASRATGGILLAAKRSSKGLLLSTIAGAVVGIIAVPIFAINWGSGGAFAAVALAELAVLTSQVVIARYGR